MIGLSSLLSAWRCEDVLPAFSNHSEELLNCLLQLVQGECNVDMMILWL